MVRTTRVYFPYL